MSSTDRLDDLLSEALHDDRLALPVSPDTLSAVRRSRARRQRVRAVGAVGATGSLVLASVLVVQSVRPTTPSSSLRPAAGGPPASSPATPASSVPGISPAWMPNSGNDWLMTTAEYDAFEASHTRAPVPSPGPGQGRVPSPAPLASPSAQLADEGGHADLPTGTDVRREDSPGGDPDATALHLTLADGTPVEVERRQLPGPLPFHAYAGDGVNEGATERPVPGTSAGAAVYPQYGYGFPPPYAGTDPAVGAHGVAVVTEDGVMTTWAAPASVPLADLQRWAFTAAQWASTHQA